MFPNVRAKLGYRNMTRLDLSDATGIKYQTLNAKLNGDSELTLADAVKIKRALKTDMPLEDLFDPNATDESA